VEGTTHVRIAGVVTLYHPPPSVIGNIGTYLPEVDVLYVFDNSPGECRELVEAIRGMEKVRYLTAGTNSGIGTALNTAGRMAVQEGYEYLLTMDQDSVASDGMIRTMLACPVDTGSVGILAPFHQYREADLVPPEPDVEPLAAALTSGNLLRLAAFKETGGFMEKLFIDYVDVEYCMRLQIHGFSVLRANRAVLLHRLGGMTSRRFLGLTVHPVDHSPSRYYYQTRNRFYIRALYGDRFPEYFRLDLKAFRRGILKMLLYEKQRRRKLVMIWRGFLALRRNDFSPIPMA
jgi:rhamnosyltransferase